MSKSKTKTLRVFEWINNNCDSMCFITTIVVSFLPWFISESACGFYAGVGGFSSALSMIFLMWYQNDGRPESKLYSILGIVVMILGVLSMMIITSLQPKENPEPIVNFLYTYFGALMGMIIGAAVIGTIASKTD